MELSGQIMAKREAAARARKLSLEFLSEADRLRVLAFAAELDSQADALEAERAVVQAARVTQTQMQMQQGPPKEAEDKG
jgi:hypothetical protein